MSLRPVLVVQRNDTWAVVASNRKIIADGFATNAEAWRWIDRHTYEGLDDTDRHNRIRNAFSGEH